MQTASRTPLDIPALATSEQQIENLIEAAYAALDFPPGTEPDWPRFHASFHERALLAIRVFPTDPAVRVLNLSEYVQAQMENDLSEQGYSETPGPRTIEITHDVALVRQQFTMNFAEQPPVAAIDIFSLIRTKAGWRVVSVVSDIKDMKATRDTKPHLQQVIIGVDPHKLSATIEIVDAHEKLLGSGRFTTDQDGYAAMCTYAKTWPGRVWAVEGANGVGRPLAQRLLEDGELVVDVPAKLAARVRLLDTGHNRKTDAHDAHAVAVVAVRTKTLRTLQVDGELEALRILTDRREALTLRRVQTVDQLQALLAELLPGQAKRDITTGQAKTMLASVRRRDGRPYYRRKRAAGKKPMEAMRCLKRRISDAIYRQLLADAARLGAGPGGHCGATQESSAVDLPPHIDTSDRPLPGPANQTLQPATRPRKTQRQHTRQ